MRWNTAHARENVRAVSGGDQTASTGAVVAKVVSAISAGALALYCHSEVTRGGQHRLGGILPLPVAYSTAGIDSDGLDEEERRTIKIFESASKSVLFVTNVVTGRPNL